MLRKPSVEELGIILETIEKRCEERVRKIEDRHLRDIEIIIDRARQDPTINCVDCGKNVYLSPMTYWNIEDSDVKCTNCKAILTITLKDGELKKINLKKAGSSN